MQLTLQPVRPRTDDLYCGADDMCHPRKTAGEECHIDWECENAMCEFDEDPTTGVCASVPLSCDGA